MEKIKKLIEIGVALKAFGINGGLKVLLHNINSKILKNGLFLYLHKDNVEIKLTVESTLSKNIIFFKESNSRDSAKLYSGAKIFASRDDFPKLNNDEFYHSDLIGLRLEDRCNNFIGKITGFSYNKIQILLNFKDINNNTSSFPFVESFIVEINENRKKVIVNLPDGLISYI